MYKIQNRIYIDGSIGSACAVICLDGLATIPFDPANSDYANFKAQILADEAELQDADSNLMSPEEAKAFVATLP